MSNLESVLRETLTCAGDAVPPPPAAGIIARARRAHRRRRTTSGVATAVAVLAVVAVVVAVTARSPLGSRHSEPAATRTPTQADFERAFAAFGAGLVPMAGRFVDGEHGFLDTQDCRDATVSASGRSCGRTLLATSDGGRSFAVRTLPAGSSRQDRLYVFDAQHLVVTTDWTGGVAGASHRWVSSDAGRTWRSVSPAPSGTVSTIPEGGQLFELTTAAGRRLAETDYVLLANGSSYRLAGTPGGLVTGGHNPFTGEIGGRFFMTTAPGGPLAVWSSSDRGASWQRAVLPAPAQDFTVMGFGGGRYLAAAELNGVGGPGDGVGGPGDPALTSTDGVHWQMVPSPSYASIPSWEPGYGKCPIAGTGLDPAPVPGSTFAPRPPRSPTTTPTAAQTCLAWEVDIGMSPGGLLVSDNTSLWRLAPGTSSFRKVNGALSTSGFLDLGGALAADLFDGKRLALYLTTDGVHWHPAGLP